MGHLKKMNRCQRHQMFIEKMTIDVGTTPAGVEYLP